VTGGMPSVTGGMPSVTGGMPSVTGGMPSVTGGMPSVTGGATATGGATGTGGSAPTTGSSSGCGWVNFADRWFTKAWCEGTKSTGYREWSGTDTTFTGDGGSFYASWESAGGNWIPDISRHAGDPNHWPPVSSLAENYSVSWTGSGDVTPNGGDYTFGLKFELAAMDHWQDYDMTSSYECYIVTQTSRTDWSWMTRYVGTVYPPGSPVGYDCYMQVQGSFVQLWAVRQQNSWNGPVNLQAIIKYWADNSGTSLDYDTWYYQGVSICAETFGSQGWIRIENVTIPS
jgi:hypothetical protein